MTACGAENNEKANENETDLAEEVEETDVEKDVDANEELVDEGNEEETDADEMDKDDKEITVKAIYIGLHDPHTIQVKTETEEIDLQILELDKEVDFEAIEMGTEVIITYYTNEYGQNVLTDIDFND